MKLVIIILSGFFSSSYCDINSVRTDFYSDEKSESQLYEFIEKVSEMPCPEITPYLACALMQRAEHSAWPPNQLKYFNEGKEKLDKYISENPNDIEARYIRLLVQTESPSFLGYNNHLKADANSIRDNLDFTILPEWMKKDMLTLANKILS